MQSPQTGSSSRGCCPYIPEEKLFDTTQPLAIRLLAEWYNLHIGFSRALRLYWVGCVRPRQFINDLQHKNAIEFLGYIQGILIASIQTQIRLGGLRKEFTQDYYSNHLLALKAFHDIEGEGDLFKTVYGAMHIKIEKQSYFHTPRFPCFVPGDHTNKDFIEHEKEIVQLAIRTELIIAGIESVWRGEIDSRVFLIWFAHYSSLMTTSFASRKFLPFWNWARVDRGYNSREMIFAYCYCWASISGIFIDESESASSGIKREALETSSLPPKRKRTEI